MSDPVLGWRAERGARRFRVGGNARPIASIAAGVLAGMVAAGSVGSPRSEPDAVPAEELPAAGGQAGDLDGVAADMRRSLEKRAAVATGAANDARQTGVTARPGEPARSVAAAPPDAAQLARRLDRAALLAGALRAAGVDATGFDSAAARVRLALTRPLAPEEAVGVARDLDAAVRQLALSNPLLDFDELLLVRRSARNLGLPANWESNSSLNPTGYGNDIALLSLRSGLARDPGTDGQRLPSAFRPDADRFVGDLDLHFDGDRLLFSMPDARGQWQVFEVDVRREAGRTSLEGLRALPLIPDDDVANYDACYLPDGNIVFTSSAPFVGVPCVNGASRVTNLYRLDRPTGAIRRLTFDQDHDWCPTVLADGRVMYLRWEYADLPHSNSRILFSMNPDGTGQMEHYGGNSYWPNGVFYARGVPGHPSKVVGIVTGHHGVRRSGELVLFDPAVSTQEADGALHRFGQRGQRIEPVVRDNLVDGSWPKFLHPWPLSDSFVLVACQPTPQSWWGLYLVDAFDNLVLLAEEPGMALLEPTPLRRSARPPIQPARSDPSRKDALVYVADIYRGGGLRGIPRGTVKRLRLFAYHFCYQGIGGLLGGVGADGPWDIRRVLGTVPVESDGSAYFRIPACTAISVQPLDADAQALQIMRSWFVGMPGENVSCVGCHERQRESAAVRSAGRALSRAPSEIEPWRGPVRGFAFAREVQPVLDRHCLRCHAPHAAGHDSARMPDLRPTPVQGWSSRYASHINGNHSVAYDALHRYVRRSGIESDMHLLMPMEFHVSTTELVQMLRRGHHGVRLDSEAWDRLATWIDLNAPYHGTWGELFGASRTEQQSQRRRELLQRCAGLDDDPEAIPSAPAVHAAPAAAAREETRHDPPPTVEGWPFDERAAGRRQAEFGARARSVSLGAGVTLNLVRVPPGPYVAGSADPDAPADERPRAVKIEQPFWIGCFEITNEQYGRFDPLHDSHVEDKHGYQFGVHGYAVNGPRQPVVRVSWRRAVEFCQWLSRQAADTGLTFSLPSEDQWEWACRAGSFAPFHYGGFDADFSAFANVGDAKLSEFATDPYSENEPMANPNRFDDWVPKDARFNDGALISTDVGRYRPNAWGVHDMHGNVAEWTACAGNRGAGDAADPVIARGGSWYDRPRRCTASFRLAYRPYQGVFNVGFRVVAHE